MVSCKAVVLQSYCIWLTMLIVESNSRLPLVNKVDSRIQLKTASS